MISIIIYGRNDQHGYNYHKRFAISLNCLASLLSHPQDEIIFVDYNTPDALPTLPEALHDTLTSKTKQHLRILRVRHHHHTPFSLRSHLPVLEPIARNVAIRRMRKENKWVLSTNPDVICVPRKSGTSLTELVSQLANGFYCLPRLEIPEQLWESSFDRQAPNTTIAFLQQNIESLHLNTVVKKTGCLQYNNPGDFQLMLQDDIMAIGGFDERMILGWHIDANLATRMSLYRPTTSSTLAPFLSVYHCNHNYKESLIHKHHRVENSWHNFVSNVTHPILTQKNWGLANEEIEEISLSRTYIPRLLSTLSSFPLRQCEWTISSDLSAEWMKAPERAFTGLVDILSSFPPNATIIYLGYQKKMLSLLSQYFDQGSKILCLAPMKKDFMHYENIQEASLLEMRTKGSAIILDFETDQLLSKNTLQKRMIHNLIALQKGCSSAIPWIGIHLQRTPFLSLFSYYLTISSHSYITGVTLGYRKNKSLHWLYHFSNKRHFLEFCQYLALRYCFRYFESIRNHALRFKTIQAASKS